tara:strand:+ start:50 stop:988 length:939 start_codon:yes stop_codon:yes gene_type:complete
MEKNKSNDLNSYDHIDLNELFFILWNKKLLILLATSIFAILSINYSLRLPNIYTSEALLAPSNQSESMNSTLASYSALAGLAGVSLPTGSASKSQEAIERMQSLDFFSNYFLPKINLQDLMAVSTWVPETNSLNYDASLFDQKSNKWVRSVSFPKTTVPSNQEAHKIFMNIFSFSEDSSSGFVSIAIDHQSPYIAKKWVEIIIKNINESMREADKNLSIEAINFLNERAKVTRLTDLKDAISQLLESQMQTLMMASVAEGYVFKTISSPVVSEEKSAPSRSLICILGTIFGFFMGIILALAIHFYKNFKEKS